MNPPRSPDHGSAGSSLPEEGPPQDARMAARYWIVILFWAAAFLLMMLFEVVASIVRR